MDIGRSPTWAVCAAANGDNLHAATPTNRITMKWRWLRWVVASIVGSTSHCWMVLYIGEIDSSALRSSGNNWDLWPYRPCPSARHYARWPYSGAGGLMHPRGSVR